MPVDLDNLSKVIEYSFHFENICAIEGINPRRRVGALIHGTALLIESLGDWVMSLKGDHPIRKWSVVPHSVDNLAPQASTCPPDGGHRQNGLDQRRILTLSVSFQEIDKVPAVPVLFVIIDFSQAFRRRCLQVRKSDVVFFAEALKGLFRSVTILHIHFD